MTKESNDSKSHSPEKLLIDNPSDFQFHAAYLTYSETYDKVSDPEIREKLNNNIAALQRNEIDYQTFYRNINQYRTEANSDQRYGRTHIKTQKKREWRRAAQKRERNKRYRR